jgi:uncharacterized protein (DUF1015 family)
MSDIRPFRGIRPVPEHAAKIACPPYDVINTDEARALAEGNPISFLHVDKAEIDFPPGFNLYDPAVYAKAAENLHKMLAQGLLKQDAKECFYIYEQTMGDHTQKGFVVGASVDEYEQNLIKKHELTRKDKEDDRTRHVEALMANSGLVFLCYKHRAAIDGLLDEASQGAPVYDFVAHDKVRHRFWVVADDALIARIQQAFLAIEAMYIADGHHRSASGYRVRDILRAKNPKHTGNEAYNHVLAVVFPDDQLHILPYNRVVKDLNGHGPADFLKKIEEKFVVRPTTQKAPTKALHFGMFLEGQWYELEARPGTFPAADPVLSLDVSILQNNLLDPLLGIKDPRTDKRVDFVGGIRGTAELERRCAKDMKVAFSMFPTSIQQLESIADAGQIMPPKSTWFEPKLSSGIVLRSLADK